MPADAKNTPPSPQIIKPSGELKRKAPLGRVELSAALALAQHVIAEQGKDYPQRLNEDIAKLKALYVAIKAVPDQRSLKDLSYLSHDMKGQGTTFGFDLVTLICDMLCNYLDKLEAVTPHALEVIGVHVDALALVAHEGLKGMGGPAGEVLIKGLHKVLEKEIKKA
jgi:hypothetical protein